MQSFGFNTSHFKAHSVRGAAATAMLANGAPQDLTRQRGGWSNPQAFDRHYARLHQALDWDALLQKSLLRTVPLSPLGERLEDASVSAGCSALTTPTTFPTKEGNSGGVEGREQPALTLLHAKGLFLTTMDNRI